MSMQRHNEPTLYERHACWAKYGKYGSLFRMAVLWYWVWNHFALKFSAYFKAISWKGKSYNTDANVITFLPRTPLRPLGPLGPGSPFGPAGPAGPFGPGKPISPSVPCTNHLFIHEYKTMFKCKSSPEWKEQ